MDPPRTVPTVMVGDVQAVLIAADWRVGSKLTVPPGNRVDWAAAPRPAGATVTLRILTGVDPAKLEVRYFMRLAGVSGLPTDDGTMIECKTAAGSACQYAIGRAELSVSFKPPADAAAVVVSGRWYIPQRDRSPGEIGVESASWGVRFT